MLAAVNIRMLLSGAFRDDPPADIVAVHTREVAVEHHHVVARDGQTAQRLAPVQRDIDSHALAAQPRGDRSRHDLIVLGDKNSHAQPLMGLDRSGRW